MRYSRKDCLDKFYTSRETAEKCVECLDLNLYDLIIEPSAGDGAFVDAIPRKIVAIDIDPGRKDIEKQDFFTLYTDVCPSKVLVIGNPPFGKQNNLALKFISKAAALADTIAFILPRSFMKDSVQNRVPKSLHLDYVMPIEPNSFLFKGEPYHVPTVFQIWKKGLNRAKRVPAKPCGYDYVDSSQANLCIRRVGYYAGKATLDLSKNKESHFFVKVYDETKVPGVVEKLNSYHWDHNDTVGPRTVSKYDLNKLLNSILS